MNRLAEGPSDEFAFDWQRIRNLLWLAVRVRPGCGNIVEVVMQGYTVIRHCDPSLYAVTESCHAFFFAAPESFNFVWWSLGLLFIGVAVSRFVWPKKVVEIPPPTIAFSKDVCPQNLRITLMESGQMPPDILRMRVKISTRTECKDEVQLALVAWLEDDTTDHLTDYHIEKSNLFSPIPEQRELQMHVTEAFLRRAAPEHQVMLTLLALPARLTPSDWSKVTTVNQAVRNGGSVIVVAGFQLRCKCPGKKGCSTSLKRFHRVPSAP